MTMKRRSFLAMLGAAATTPFLPAKGAKAVSLSAAAGYSRYSYGMAVFHARTRAHVSARGLAHCLKVTKVQAEAMIAEMSKQGLVTPVTGVPGRVRALSNILKPDAWGLDQATRRARAADRRSRHLRSTDGADLPRYDVDLSRLMTHLRDLCDHHFGQGPQTATV